MNLNSINISLDDIEVPENYADDAGFQDDTVKPRKRAPEAIKNPDDIQKLSDYFIVNEKWRDNMLFICGINFGLRCGDLLKLTFGRIITMSTGKPTFKEKFEIIEEKTKKRRVVGINAAVRKAVCLYLKHSNQKYGSDYMFVSECNKESNKEPKPLRVGSVERILKAAAAATGVDLIIATHTLRKTFAYHMIMQAPDRSRAIDILQKILGHDSQSDTLLYAGITDSEIRDMYQNINLGYGHSELIALDGTREIRRRIA